MICSNCHKEVSDDSIFCPECGKKIEKDVTCPKCGAINPPSFKYCNQCGHSLQTEETVKTPKKEKPKKDVKIDSEKIKAVANRLLPISAMSFLMFVLVLTFGLMFTPFLSDNFLPSSQFTIIQYFANVQNTLSSLQANYQYIDIFHSYFLLSLFVSLGVLIIVASIIGGIKMAKAIREKEFCDFSNYAIIVYILFAFIYFYFTRIVLNGEAQYASSIGGGPTTIMVLMPIALSFNHFVKEYLKKENNIPYLIAGNIARLILFVFVLLSLSKLGGIRFDAQYLVYAGSGNTISGAGRFNNPDIISLLLSHANRIYVESTPFVTSIIAESGIAFFFELVLMGLFSILLGFIFKGEGKKRYIQGMVFSGLGAAFALANLLLNSFTNKSLNSLDSLSEYGIAVSSHLQNSGVICYLVFSLILLGVSIGSLVLEKRLKGKKTDE